MSLSGLFCTTEGCPFRIADYSQYSVLKAHQKSCALNRKKKERKLSSTAAPSQASFDLTEKKEDRLYALKGTRSEEIGRRIKKFMKANTWDKFRKEYTDFVQKSEHIDFLCSSSDDAFDRDQYLNWQRQLYQRFSSDEALQSSNLDEYVKKSRKSLHHDKRLKIDKAFYDIIRNMKSRSGSEADKLLSFINEVINPCTCGKVKGLLQAKFRSIKTRVLRDIDLNPQVTNLNLAWPGAWRMDEMLYPMDVVELRVLNPMQIVAEWFVDPEVNFGSESLRLKTKSHQREVDCLYDSQWARETEKEILNKDPNGIMLTLMFYEDKVSIGGGSPHGFNAAVMTSGNFSLSQTNRDISKAMLGYIPWLESAGEIKSHLRDTLKWTQKFVDDQIKQFNMLIARKFWEIVLTSVHNCWERGVKLFHLGEIINVYPCIPFAKGDEPALKSQTGIMQGNCAHSCLTCTFDSLQGVTTFDPETHLYRDPINLYKLSCIGEEATLMKSKGQTLTHLQTTILADCQRNSIYPLRTCYLESYMGVIPTEVEKEIRHTMNTIYFVPRDLLHTVDAGVVKSCLLYSLMIIDGIRAYSKDHKTLFQDVDGRIRYFLTPPTQPHLHWRKFSSGLSFILNSYTLKKKGRSTGSGGGIRSNNFIVALIQLYFSIAGLIPDSSLILQSRRHRTEVKNVSKTLITCIGSVIDIYFELKRESWTNKEIQALEEKVKAVTTNVVTLWKLKEIVTSGALDSPLNSHKLHALSHFPLYIRLFGPSIYWDCGSTETFHKAYTVSQYHLTSKRLSDENAEMFNHIKYKRYNRWSRLIELVCWHGKVDLSEREKKGRVCDTPAGQNHEDVEFYIDEKQYRMKCVLENGHLQQVIRVGKSDSRDEIEHICMTNNLSRKHLDKLILGHEVFEDILSNKKEYFITYTTILKFTGSVDSGIPKGFIYACDKEGKVRHDFIEINLDSGEEGENRVVAKVVAIFEVSEEDCDAAKFLLVVQYLMALPVDKQKNALRRHSSVHYKNCCKLLGWELTYQRAKGGARVYGNFAVIDAACIIHTAFVIPAPADSLRAKGLKDELFFFIPQKVFDRSGWSPTESIGTCDIADLGARASVITSGNPVHDRDNRRINNHASKISGHDTSESAKDGTIDNYFKRSDGSRDDQRMSIIHHASELSSHGTRMACDQPLKKSRGKSVLESVPQADDDSESEPESELEFEYNSDDPGHDDDML